MRAVGGTATTILVSYAIVCVLAAAFIVWIALSTRAPRAATERAHGHGRLGEFERTWFVVVIVLLAALLFATIFLTPYGRSAGKDAQVVPIKAVQFAWLVPGKPIRAGTPVEFRLTSADVNHGFAVYNAAGTLLFMVQVMPDETQKYVYTFEQPGTYTILCLEFCGVGHGRMEGRLTVVK
jgi:cytochrome c oxidase subunit II